MAAAFGVTSICCIWLLAALHICSFSVSNAQTYAVIIPRTASRGTTLQALVYVFQNSQKLTLNVSLVDPKATTLFSNSQVVPDSSGVASVAVNIGLSWLAGTYRFLIRASDKSFSSTARFDILEKTSSVFVTLDKSAYAPSQTVNFRVLVISTELKPATGFINVTVQDSNRLKVRQWIKQPLSLGVASFSLTLADAPTPGGWAVIVNYGLQEFTKEFVVVSYGPARFQITTSLPNYITTSASTVAGSVSAVYATGEGVKGVASIGAFLLGRSVVKSVQIDGKVNFVLNSADLAVLNVSRAAYGRLLVQANVTETSAGVTIVGGSAVTVYPSDAVITFLPATADTFKPGQTFRAYVQVNRPDGSLLPEQGQKLQLSVYSAYYVAQKNSGNSSTQPESTANPTIVIANLSLTIPSDGIVVADVLVPANILYMTINASINYRRQVVTNSFDVGKFAKSGNNSIGVYIREPADSLKVGDTVSLKIIANRPVTAYFLIAVSRGRVISNASFPGARSNINVTLVPEHSPEVTFIVWTRDGGELLADGVTVPIAGIFANKINISFEDASGNAITEVNAGDSVLLKVLADPFSLVGVLAVDQSVLRSRSPYGLPFGQVLDEIQNFAEDDNDDFPVFFGFSRPRWGLGVSSGHVFTNAKLLLYTDAKITRQQFIDIPEDAVSNIPLPPSPPVVDDSSAVVVSLPAPRRVIPDTWIWALLPVDASGEARVIEQVPNNVTSWLATGFSISAASGLAVTPGSTKLKASQRFTSAIYNPDTAILGEEVSLKVVVTNNVNSPQNFSVFLEPCNLYSARPATSNYGRPNVGQTIAVPANGTATAQFWIRATNLGNIKIGAVVTAYNGTARLETTLVVKPAGFPQSYCLTDLQNISKGCSNSREFNLQYPTEVVPQSKQIFVGVSGDVFGQSLQQMEQLVRLPTGCGEQVMARFAPSVIIRDYLEATGQITSSWRARTDANMLLGIQRELKYWRYDGFFSGFGDTDDNGSTWLTAYVLKIFRLAAQYLTKDIDSIIFSGAVDALQSTLNPDGSFVENGHVIHVEMQGNSNSTVALSAYVLIAILERNNNTLSSRAWTNATVKFLEQSLQGIASDPYKTAMVAYALALARSSRVSSALQMLETIAASADDEACGSGVKMPNGCSSDEQCYYCPTPKGSSQIEMMSYALLTYAQVADLGKASAVARWLVNKRSLLGGYTGTQDTVLALQALAAYARLIRRSGTSLVVSLTAEGREAIPRFTVDDANLLSFQSYKLTTTEKTTPSIKYTAKGQGMVAVTVCTSFNVLNVPTNPAVSLNVTVVPTSSGRTTAVVRFCASTNDTDRAGGMAIVQVRLPTGFTVNQGSVTSDSARTVDYDSNQVSLYFNQFNSSLTCATISMQQTYPVKSLASAYIIAAPYYNYDQKTVAAYNPVTGVVSYVNLPTSPCKKFKGDKDKGDSSTSRQQSW